VILPPPGFAQPIPDPSPARISEGEACRRMDELWPVEEFDPEAPQKIAVYDIKAEIERLRAEVTPVRPFICPDCRGPFYGVDGDGFYGDGDGKPAGDCPMCNPQ